MTDAVDKAAAACGAADAGAGHAPAPAAPAVPDAPPAGADAGADAPPPSILPIVSALERAHAHFNSCLFGGMLRRMPTVTVQTRGRKAALGWYAYTGWGDGKGHNAAELNVSAEFTRRPAEEVLLTLVHEMVHQRAHEGEIKDTSRDGRYHNKTFARLA